MSAENMPPTSSPSPQPLSAKIRRPLSNDHQPLSAMHEATYRELLRRTAIALAICTVAVLICYAWIDRPVAFFVRRHELNAYPVFRWLTLPPPLVQSWSPLVIAALLVRRAWAPFARWQHVLLVACLSLLVADQFRTSLGDLCGRYWPETWFDDNPSLIGNGTYGFHPFAHGDDVGSFPSGHAARILGFAGVWWLAMPRSRALVAFICPPMLVSLVAMNYHFVGDVIAGAALGAIVAAYAVRLAALNGVPRPAAEATAAPAAPPA
jgi:membrane-associated phospholipid phosphatase